MSFPSLVGRNLEVDTIGDLLRTGGPLIVRGPAGIGKSTLLIEAERLARARGMQVHSVTGVQAETHLPFAGLHQLLRPIMRAADDLPPPQRDALAAAFGVIDGEAPNLFLVALGTLNLLAEEAGDEGLVVIAEDAQWLDPGTRDVLAFVARRLGTDPVSLLMAIRDGHDNRLADAGIPELHLEGLDRDASIELLDALAPGLPPSVRDRLAEEAVGNPLALVELPSALASEQLAGTAVLPGVLPLTERLERAFTAQAGALPDATRSQLLIAALNDSGAIDEVLRASAALEGRAGATQELEEAAAARLVDLDANELRFRHPLVRSAIAQAASDEDRRAAHAALADVLVGHPDRRAWHRAASIVGTDDDAAMELEAAARRAQQRGGIAAAVAGLERAAELSDNQGDRGRRLMHAAELAFELGRRDLLSRLLQRAELLELGELERGRVTWIREMTAQRILGTAEIRSLVGVADRARELGDRNLAIDLIWLLAQRCYWSAPEKEAGAAVLEAAARLGSAGSDLRLLAIVAYVAPIERGREIVAAVSRTPSNLDADPEAARLLGTAAAVVGAFALAAPALASSAAGLRARGRLGHLARVLVLEGWAASHLADWTLAVPAGEEARTFAAEAAEPLWEAGAKVVQAQIAALRGDTEEVDRLTAEIERIGLPLRVNFLLAAAQIARGVSALGGGRYDEAYEHLRRLFDRVDPAHHPLISTLAVGGLAEAAAHAERSAEARAVLEVLAPFEDRAASPSFHAGMRFARALLADDGEAEPLFQVALDADLSGLPFDRARVLLAYGTWLRRQRRVAEARAPLRAARDAFDALGAVPWGDRARQELRASGETSRPRTPEVRDQLTPQELQIAQMAAQGLSNREIGHRLYLSHRTVGSHLYRIFPKLGIAARSDLRDALTSAGSVTLTVT
jgi:DNA-binding CsgD family transcriptional regulator